MNICLFFLIFADSFASYSDSTQTIYIFTKDDDVAAFRTIGKIFNSSGYDLEDSEEALMVVSTEIMNKEYGTFNLDKVAIKLCAEINMSDSITTIKLQGQYLDRANMRSELSEEYFTEHSNRITNTGASGSKEETAWNYMLEIANKYKNGRIKIQR
ncbi:MAG: hypothetical protein Q8940_13965 [Bacteroidota bacterium]|nr:hypothetical protein [Bacteroidota bacterium]